MQFYTICVNTCICTILFIGTSSLPSSTTLHCYQWTLLVQLFQLLRSSGAGVSPSVLSVSVSSVSALVSVSVLGSVSVVSGSVHLQFFTCIYCLWISTDCFFYCGRFLTTDSSTVEFLELLSLLSGGWANSSVTISVCDSKNCCSP